MSAIKQSLALWLPERLFALSGELAVTGQSQLAVSGQILLCRQQTYLHNRAPGTGGDSARAKPLTGYMCNS